MLHRALLDGLPADRDASRRTEITELPAVPNRRSAEEEKEEEKHDNEKKNCENSERNGWIHTNS